MANIKMRVLLVAGSHLRVRYFEAAFNCLGYYRVAPAYSVAEALMLSECVVGGFELMMVDSEMLGSPELALMNKYCAQGWMGRFILCGSIGFSASSAKLFRCPGFLGCVPGAFTAKDLEALVGELDPIVQEARSPRERAVAGVFGAGGVVGC